MVLSCRAQRQLNDILLLREEFVNCKAETQIGQTLYLLPHDDRAGDIRLTGKADHKSVCNADKHERNYSTKAKESDGADLYR